jgi:hypothetical protein
MTHIPKIYLDTSAISHLDQPGKPSEYGYTHLFWRDIDKYEVFISEVVVRELSKCDDEKAELFNEKYCRQRALRTLGT